VADHPRIEELRRRVQNDPASIAFAQLAEEYRRAGSYHEAVDTCRAGLKIHPGYLSARVTLGRALIETNDLEAAEIELRHVLKTASENLSAIRGLAEIHHRRGQLTEALGFYRAALGLAKHDPDLEQAVDEISRSLAPQPVPDANGMSFDEAQAEFLAALDEFEAIGANEEPGAIGAMGAMGASGAVATQAAPVAPTAPLAPIAPGLSALERFLDAIHTYRRRRAV